MHTVKTARWFAPMMVKKNFVLFGLVLILALTGVTMSVFNQRSASNALPIASSGSGIVANQTEHMRFLESNLDLPVAGVAANEIGVAQTTRMRFLEANLDLPGSYVSSISASLVSYDHMRFLEANLYLPGDDVGIHQVTGADDNPKSGPY